MTEQDKELQPLDPQTIDRRSFLKTAAIIGGGTLLAASGPLQSALAAAPVWNAKKSTHKSALEEKMLQHKPELSTYAPQHPMPVRTFENLSKVDGLSQSQLTQHLGLYKGYVDKINGIVTTLHDLQANDPTKFDARTFRALQLDQSYAANGAVLHEYYFENMGGDRAKPSAALQNLVTREYGSWANYQAHLSELGKGMRGWVLTGYNTWDKRIHNYGLDTHDQGMPAGVIPLLVLDVYEHAYMIDFGTKRADYLSVFFSNVDWNIVERRLASALPYA